MQQILLISLSAQVEYLVQSMAKLNAVTAQGFDEKINQLNKLGENMEKTDSKVRDLGVAIAKTTRFDEKMLDDNQAVLIRVSDKCVGIENLIMNVGIKVGKKETPKKEVKDNVEKDTTEKDFDEKTEDEPKKINKKTNETWIGTSISRVMDQKKLEKDLDVSLTVSKAYCIKAEEKARFKDKNLESVVQNVLKTVPTDVLILQTGSIEITDIDVNHALMDSKTDIGEYKEKWFSKVENDSKNLYDVAEEACKHNPKLKAIIVKRLPRFDRSSNDLLSIKAQLSNYAYSVFDQIWLRKGKPSSINIVEFQLNASNHPYLTP